MRWNTKEILRLFLCILVYLIPETVVSQEPIFKQFTIQQGLITNTIYDIQQDQQGFIWLATDKGLIRFNGRNFKNYPIEGNKSPEVSNILFTENNQIWVQNFYGQHFKQENDYLIYEKKLSKNQYFVLNHTLKNQIVRVIDNRLETFDIINNELTFKELDENYIIASTNSTKDKFGFANFNNGKLLYIRSDGSIQKENYHLPFTDYFFWTFDQKEEYFVGKTEQKIIVKSTGKSYSFSHLIPNTYVQNTDIIDGKLAIMTTNGVLIFDPRNETFSKIMSAYSCSRILKDQEGNYWVSTLGDGLFQFPYFEAKNYISNQEITEIELIGNEIIFGTKKNQVYLFDPLKPQLIHQGKINHAIKSIFKNELGLFIGAEGFIWKDKKINYKSNISVNEIQALDETHVLLSESGTLSIFPVTEKDKWMKWKTKDRTFHENRLSILGNYKRVLQAIYFQNQIVSLRNDGLWISTQTSNKHIQLTDKNVDFINLFHDKKDLYVATAKNGIYRIVNNRLIPLKTLNQHIDKTAIRLAKVFDGTLYILTDVGIMAFNKKEQIIDYWKYAEGYPNFTVLDFVLKNKYLYAATSSGLKVFPFHNRTKKKFKTRLYLDKIKVNGRSMNPSSLLRSTGFQPDEQNWTFQVAVIDYRSFGRHSVQYSINYKKWRILETEKLLLSELSPGKYTIRFAVFDDENKPISKQIFTRFYIQAPFYQRLWFIVLCFFVLVGLSYFFFRLRLKQVEHKNELINEKIILERKLKESSLSAIKAQMNPHFIFNALNTIQSFIYTNEKEAASSYLVDFSELTRKILEMSNKERIPLSEEIRSLELYLKLEKMRFEDDFEFEINLSSLPHVSFQIPSMLIQPYVENSIKHGLLHKKGSKKISVDFTLKEEMLFIEIKDNGIGMKASKEINQNKAKIHPSFANSANQTRFEILNQLYDRKIGVELKTIYTHEKEVAGTLVELRIPI